MNKRIRIVNAEIQKAISKIIMEEIKNPKITGIISVTAVDTTSDLDYAKVYLSVFTKDNKEDVFNEIKHSAGFIRKKLSQEVDLRKTPYLTFILDESADYGAKIDKKIEEIQAGRQE